MEKIFTRMGDGSVAYQTSEEMMQDIVAGCSAAAKKAKVPELTREEKEHILEIFTRKDRIVGVEPGREIVMTSDVGDDTAICMVGTSFSRPESVMIMEKIIGMDSCDIGCQEYSYKNIKNIIELSETPEARNALNQSIFPIFYGSMPNLGLYTQPDGMFPNWNELLPAGKVDEARKSQEEAAEVCANDIYNVAKRMYEVGVDAINLDTTGAAGDGDFLAGLKATERITRDMPGFPVEMGMSSEFVLGTHAGLKYNGKRLAGMWPHQQVQLAEEAGVSIFGPVVNINTSHSSVWNISFVCTVLKECSKVSKIPLHANAGMGVCGMPMSSTVGADIVSRVDKCLVEICNMDGL